MRAAQERIDPRAARSKNRNASAQKFGASMAESAGPSPAASRRPDPSPRPPAPRGRRRSRRASPSGGEATPAQKTPCARAKTSTTSAREGLCRRDRSPRRADKPPPLACSPKLRRSGGEWGGRGGVVRHLGLWYDDGAPQRITVAQQLSDCRPFRTQIDSSAATSARSA